MLTILLGLLSSAGLGSIVGVIGGLLNRFADYKFKQLDQSHELQKLDKERDYLKLEIEGKAEVATIESEGLIESEGYKALARSYQFANVSTEDGFFLNLINKAIRPLITLVFLFATLYIAYQLNVLVGSIKEGLPADKIVDLYIEVIHWIFFQGGAVIGWWFAMRPNRSNFKLGK